MLVSPHSKTVANEGQMQVPSLMEADGTINSGYMKDFSDWFDKNFGLRSFLIGTEHRLMAAVFGESSEKKVILGSDGWLFYAETLDDYQGTNLMTKREIYSIAVSASPEKQCATPPKSCERYFFSILRASASASLI